MWPWLLVWAGIGASVYGMTNGTVSPAPTFDLLVPARGDDPSHLRLPDTAGWLCGTDTGRRAYVQMGITSANAGSCEPCRAAARAIVGQGAPTVRDIVRGERGTGTVISTIGGVFVAWRDGGQSRVPASEVTVIGHDH
jgi:hypothetical protein